MNILFLLGNGFDLNLDLKTSYKEFYENAYQTQQDDNELIKDLKSEIKENINTWADLELALGKYTKRLNNRTEFDIIFDDIRIKLANYIEQQEINFQYDTSLKDKFLEQMRFPYNFLSEGEKDTFTTLTNKPNNTQFNIYTISFNYIRSLEKIIEYKEGEPIIIENAGKTSSIFRNIEHIHGFPQARFILGVDNPEQIANESFKTDIDILTCFIKPRLNHSAGHLCDWRCKNLINSADIICIHGMSIGDTDKTWWNHIGNRIVNGSGNIKLIIFWRNEKKISEQFSDKRLFAEKEIRELFLSQSLPNKHWPSAVPHVHVAINSEIFH